MNKLSFKAIEKKLERKNAKLVEVREFRKKLDDKEKEIKNKNLDISSVSALAIVDALKNNKQILNAEEDSEKISQNEKSASEKIDSDIQLAGKNLSEEKIEDDMPEEISDEGFLSRLNANSADEVSEEK